MSYELDDDHPWIKYPHPTEGYDWEPDQYLWPKAQLGEAPVELLLKIAKEARQHKEIWENYVAEHEFVKANPWVFERSEPGPPMGGYDGEILRLVCAQERYSRRI